MGTLKILNYNHVKCDTGVRIDDIDSLYVVVVTGDEIVTAIKKDGTQETFDSAELSDDRRSHNSFDGEYAVNKEDIAEWSEREDSYYWFGRMIRDARM